MSHYTKKRESPELEERRRLIFSLIQEGRTQTAAAAELGISKARVYQILHWNLPEKVRAPDRRRTVPIRLTDVPESVRLDAAFRVCEEVDEPDRPGVFAAAVYPSDTVYWVAA